MFNVIAAVVGINVEDISTETKLGTLGMDSLMSLEIAGSLGDLLHIPINTGLFFRSETIGDLLAKLRFVTRPTLGLLRDNSGDGKGRKSSLVSRLRVINVRSCVIEVRDSFSLMELFQDAVAGFRDLLSFSEADTTMIELQTPVAEIKLLLDITTDPVSLGIDTRAVKNTTTGIQVDKMRVLV